MHKFHLVQVPVRPDGYTLTGHYAGPGAPLWRCYVDARRTMCLVRALSRSAAKRAVMALYPHVTLCRFYK